jgi:hypothetical protein
MKFRGWWTRLAMTLNDVICIPSTTERGVSLGQSGTINFQIRRKDMGDTGKKDKGKREQQKKAQLSPQEKRKLKREKKK